MKAAPPPPPTPLPPLSEKTGEPRRATGRYVGLSGPLTSLPPPLPPRPALCRPAASLHSASSNRNVRGGSRRKLPLPAVLEPGGPDGRAVPSLPSHAPPPLRILHRLAVCSWGGGCDGVFRRPRRAGAVATHRPGRWLLRVGPRDGGGGVGGQAAQGDCRPHGEVGRAGGGGCALWPRKRGGHGRTRGRGGGGTYVLYIRTCVRGEGSGRARQQAQGGAVVAEWRTGRGTPRPRG